MKTTLVTLVTLVMLAMVGCARKPEMCKPGMVVTGIAQGAPVCESLGVVMEHLVSKDGKPPAGLDGYWIDATAK